MKKFIYMDNHATTPVDPRVFEAMKPYFMEDFGNAASRTHVFGWRAAEAVKIAREQIARLINAEPDEIIFTSGATESDNLAIKGVAAAYAEKGNHIITCQTEHKAVLDSCKRLETQGCTVTYLPVGRDGRVDPAQLRAAITDRTILITIMFANNEIGTIHPIAEIGQIAKEHGILFHCDAVQALGKVPCDVQALGIDLLSISAHKMYGPKGIGALYVRRRKPRVKLVPIIDGGGHERGMRSGTLNVPGIVGLGKACDICREEMALESARLAALRDKLQNYLMTHLDEVYVNGSIEHRLPNCLNMSFAYVEGESLMMGLDDVAVSSGSACTSATLEPSYVLRALGVPVELAHSSIRFGLGRFNTEAEVDYVAEKMVGVVKRLREMSPLYEMAKRGVDLSTVDWGDHGHAQGGHGHSH
ncbi:MAG: IscS subfamily cysteine desulfurase [Candidatus Sumerlaeia bacterium]|nr:IscS subfamily cysteine desulfurase [Candidatus Sumerlaeia bacterium]